MPTTKPRTVIYPDAELSRAVADYRASCGSRFASANDAWLYLVRRGLAASTGADGAAFPELVEAVRAAVREEQQEGLDRNLRVLDGRLSRLTRQGWTLRVLVLTVLRELLGWRAGANDAATWERVDARVADVERSAETTAGKRMAEERERARAESRAG